MRQLSFSGLLILLLCHAIPFIGNLKSEAPAGLPVSSLEACHSIPRHQDYNAGILLFGDPFFENNPLQRESDEGRGFSQFLSNAFLRPCGLLLASTPLIPRKKGFLISPSLDTRGIIYPFHSFL